jgi:hypothetical protein
VCLGGCRAAPMSHSSAPELHFLTKARL